MNTILLGSMGLFKKKRYYFLFLVFFLFTTFSLFANNLKLSSIFQEHMVLQRNMPIKVWGTALANKEIIIQLDTKTVKVYSDNAGNWIATLPKFKAGGPFQFQVTSGEEYINFTDVMIGEVWICSGQSNMVVPHTDISEINKLDALSKNIRTFEVPKTVSFSKEKNIENGVWALENPSGAVAFAFSYFLQKNADVPVGIILTAWGSSSLEGWLPKDLIQELPHFKTIMDTFYANNDKQERIKSILNSKEEIISKDEIFLRIQPNILYNAMMHPLIPYTCRGMVWYQGESNTKTKNDMFQYKETYTAWVDYLRTQWKQTSLDFIVVALPGYIGKKNNKPNFEAELPTEDSWAWMRESQYELDKIKNVSVVNTIDLGEAFNIHPNDKLPVGKRIALMAEKVTSSKNILAIGPKFKSYKVKGNEIIIKFLDAQGLKTNDSDSPKGFWISDENNKWHPAQAKIKGKKVIIKAKGVDKPIYVRYAFSAKPTVNLVNQSGLPALPFRTDNFKK